MKLIPVCSFTPPNSSFGLGPDLQEYVIIPHISWVKQRVYALDTGSAEQYAPDKEAQMHMRRSVVLAAVLFLLVPVLGAATTQQIDLMGADHTTEIDGSSPSYVSHGWLEYEDVWRALGYNDFRSYIRGEGIEFLLIVDGNLLSVVPPVTRFIPNHPVYGAIWSAMWNYRFKANEFTGGVHIFEGYFTLPGGDLHLPVRPIEVNYP